jgi:hypothetical protein
LNGFFYRDKNDDALDRGDPEIGTFPANLNQYFHFGSRFPVSLSRLANLARPLSWRGRYSVTVFIGRSMTAHPCADLSIVAHPKSPHR